MRMRTALSTRPDDAGDGGTFRFDFSALGTVAMHTITMVDVDRRNTNQTVKLYHDGVTGTLLATIPIPNMGNNGVAVVPINVLGADTMTVTLTKSGAIDNIEFLPEEALVAVADLD